MTTQFTWTINSLQVVQSPEPNTVTMSNFTITGDGQAKIEQIAKALPAS